MTVHRLLPTSQAYGYQLGMLLLDEVETHVPGDTAHAATFPFPVLFKVVEGASAYRVTTGDPDVEASIVAAARELEAAGVMGITSNCGFMLHYQSAVSNAVGIPAMMSSLLQLPMVSAAVGPDKTIGILTAFVDRLGQNVLALTGLAPDAKIAVTSIENTDEFRGLASEDFDTERFEARLVEAAQSLFDEHDDIGALLLECALFPPYAPALQRKFNVPVFDFVSLVDYLHSVTHRRLPHS